MKMILVSEAGSIELEMGGGGGGSREFHETHLEPQQKWYTKNTVRECHSQKNCQRLPNRGIVRDCKNDQK